MQLTPGDPLKLTDEQCQKLAPKLTNLVTDLETTYGPLFKDIATWWRWYEAIPRMREKNYPFRGASNIVVPLSQIMVDALVNRTMAALFGNGRKTWMGYTENETQEMRVDNVVRWINWAANGNDFDVKLTSYDWLLEGCAIGSSVQAINWREDVRYTYVKGPKGPKAQRVRYGRGVTLEAVPRHQILWDTNYMVGDAPCVVREYCYTWSQLQQLATNDKSGSWYKDAVEAVRDAPGHDGPSHDVQTQIRTHDGVTSEDRPGPYETHDVRCIHLDWPLYSYFAEKGYGLEAEEEMGEPTVGVVITQHRKTGKILRAIAEPYYLPYKPYFDIYYKKRPGRGHSVGVVKKLEHMQSMITTQVNQSCDAMTRANTIWATTKDRAHLDKPLDSRHPIYDPTGTFQPLTLQANTIDNQRNVQMIQVIAERLTGIADPALGRETRQGGHPSPATSTLALMGQSDMMTYSMREMIRMQLGRIGEATAALYQQYETDDDGRLSRVLGDHDAADVKQYLFPTDPIVGGMKFDVVAMNESTNPDAELQRAILVEQMNTNYWAKILRVLPALASPQLDPGTKKALAQSVVAGGAAHTRFLEVANVDDIEKLIYAAAGLSDENSRGMADAAAQLGQFAAGAGVLPQQPMAGPVLSPSGGAPGALGSLGQLQ